MKTKATTVTYHTVSRVILLSIFTSCVYVLSSAVHSITVTSAWSISIQLLTDKDKTYVNVWYELQQRIQQKRWNPMTSFSTATLLATLRSTVAERCNVSQVLRAKELEL
jgi:hypothetical protein